MIEIVVSSVSSESLPMRPNPSTISHHCVHYHSWFYSSCPVNVPTLMLNPMPLNWFSRCHQEIHSSSFSNEAVSCRNIISRPLSSCGPRHLTCDDLIHLHLGLLLLLHQEVVLFVCSQHLPHSTLFVFSHELLTPNLFSDRKTSPSRHQLPILVAVFVMDIVL